MSLPPSAASVAVSSEHFALIERHLQHRGFDRAAEGRLARELYRTIRAYRPNAELKGSRRWFVLVAGWACRARIMADGRRQILSFIIPGDMVAVCESDDQQLHETWTLTHAAVADATDLILSANDFDEGAGVLSTACIAAERAELHRHLDHIVRLGALPAYRAMGHLLLEIERRSASAGLLEGARFPLPVSQDVLGEALGLTGVHANRVLGQLRRDGFLQLGPGWAALSDRERLREIVAD